MAPYLTLRVPDKLAVVLNSILKDDGDGSKAITVDVIPENLNFGYYSFKLNDIEYPALLSNTPTLVEAYKTFDTKVILKSADIGQMLQVFESDNEREEMRALTKQIDGNDVLPHGLTIPTLDIVERKFKKTRKHKRQPYHKIAEVIEMVETPWELSENTNGSTEQFKEHIEQFQEVVAFEEWMIDPVTDKFITIETDKIYSSSISILLDHPELLVSQLDLEDERELEEEEQMRRKLAAENKPVDSEMLRNIVSMTVVNETDNIGKESDTTSDSDDDFDLDAALEGNEEVNENLVYESKDSDKDEINLTENKSQDIGNLDDVQPEELEDHEDASEEDDGDDWMNADL